MKKNQRSTNKDHTEDYSDYEDWCFVCKDGGTLILCDHEGCSKVYHPRCVGKRISFFRNQKRWICSHHSCNACGSAVTGAKSISCLLCPYAVCGTCSESKYSEIAVVRGKERHGLCSDCLGLVRFAEVNGQYGLDGKKLDFEDPESREYGFKDCWGIVKEKEGLTLDDFYFLSSKGEKDSHDSEDKEPHRSTLRKRKEEAEISEDKEDELGSDDQKKQKSVSSSMASESESQEENHDSKEKEETIPSPTRNEDEAAVRFASIVASNMKLVYLRRSLVEELMSKQPDSWERKLVGSVRGENSTSRTVSYCAACQQLE